VAEVRNYPLVPVEAPREYPLVALEPPPASSPIARCTCTSCPWERQYREQRQQAGFWKAMFERAKARAAELQDQVDLLRAQLRLVQQQQRGRRTETTYPGAPPRPPATPDEVPPADRPHGAAPRRRIAAGGFAPGLPPPAAKPGAALDRPDPVR
jgi:hypothetical protein